MMFPLDKIALFAVYLVQLWPFGELIARIAPQPSQPARRQLLGHEGLAIVASIQVVVLLLLLGRTFDPALTAVMIIVLHVPVVALLALHLAGTTLEHTWAHGWLYWSEQRGLNKRLPPSIPWRMMSVAYVGIVAVPYFTLPSPSSQLTGWLLAVIGLQSLVWTASRLPQQVGMLLSITVDQSVRKQTAVFALASLVPTMFWLAVILSASGISGPALQVSLGPIDLAVSVSLVAVLILLLAVVVVPAWAGAVRRRQHRVGLLENELAHEKDFVNAIAIPQRGDFSKRLDDYCKTIKGAFDEYWNANPILWYQREPVTESRVEHGFQQGNLAAGISPTQDWSALVTDIKDAYKALELEDPRFLHAHRLQELRAEAYLLAVRLLSGQPRTEVCAFAMALADHVERSRADTAAEIEGVRKVRLPGAVVAGLVGTGTVGFVIERAAQIATDTLSAAVSI